MTALPAASYFTGSITNLQAKQAQDDMLAFVRQLLGGAAESTLTLSSDAATPTGGCHSIDSQAAASTDNLANLATTNLPDGSFLMIRAANASHVITVKHNAGGAGQIALAGAVDYVLDTTSKWLLLKRTSTNWEEIFRSAGGDLSVVGTFEAKQAIKLTGIISPSQITANQNDYAPTGFSTATLLRLNTDASRNVTGLAGGATGRVVKLLIIGSFPLVLVNESGSSTAANRFTIGFDLTLYPGQAVELTYDGTSSRWRITAGFVNGIPIGAGVDFWGSTAPAGFAFPYGQNVSRTTYALAFAVLGTTYGVGDGSTTFGMPDKRGRHSIAKDNMGGSAASRVTTGGSSIDGTTLGAAGGAQNVTLSSGNIPPLGVTGSGGSLPFSGAGNTVSVGSGGGGSDASVVANAGVTPTAVNKMPPGIVCNYIIFLGA